MNFYKIDRYGNISKGKANNWTDVRICLNYGDKLYNPYTKTAVIGWNNYKESMARSYKELNKKG